MRGELVLLIGLAACNAEPVLYLGAPRLPDAGAGDAAAEDAQASDDADEDEDDTPCLSQADCAERPKEPYCHEQLARCVECVSDSDCDDDEQCKVDAGDCKDR